MKSKEEEDKEELVEEASAPPTPPPCPGCRSQQGALSPRESRDP